MLKIALLSDTHGYTDDAIDKHLRNADEIWHAGDIGSIELADHFESLNSFKAVYGNIADHKVRSSYPLDLKWEVEKVSVWMTHIGGYPGRYSKRVKDEFKQGNIPQIFICGHSHILKVMKDERLSNMLVINPGAAGNHGFHKIRTMLTFELHDGNIQNLHLIELGRRGKI